MHIHVVAPDGEAKFWIEPIVSLADYTNFSKKQIKELQEVIESHAKEIEKAWKTHFSKR